MQIAFVGSRDYPDLELVRKHVQALAHKYPDAVVVSGGCRGVDRTAEAEALRCGLEVHSYRPKEQDGEWYISFNLAKADGTRGELEANPVSGNAFESCKRWPVEDTPSRGYGKPAFYRNGVIVARADRVMAYPSTPGRGTRDTIAKAKAAGTPVHIYAR